jgi:hypothetical protein
MILACSRSKALIALYMTVYESIKLIKNDNTVHIHGGEVEEKIKYDSESAKL